VRAGLSGGDARGWVRACRSLCVLTGAGVSAESGVPTFRGPEGLWKRRDPMSLATPEAFLEDPEEVWEWYQWRRRKIRGCAPNPGHAVLVALYGYGIAVSPLLLGATSYPARRFLLLNGLGAALWAMSFGYAGFGAGALVRTLSSRLSPVWLAATGAALLAGAVLILSMALCRTVVPFTAARLLLGFAVGGAPTLGYAIAGEFIPDTVRASSYSILSSTAMLGASLGPTMTGVLGAIDLRVPLVFGGVSYLALAAHAAVLMRRQSTRAAAAAAAGA